jgi:hypothetical protein
MVKISATSGQFLMHCTLGILHWITPNMKINLGNRVSITLSSHLCLMLTSMLPVLEWHLALLIFSNIGLWRNLAGSLEVDGEAEMEERIFQKVVLMTMKILTCSTRSKPVSCYGNNCVA